MNDRPGVSEHERRRIVAIAQEMGYRPPAGTRGSAPRRTHVIGLVVPNVVNPMFPRMAHGIVKHAASAGREVLLATTPEDKPRWLLATVRGLIARRVDGLILIATARKEVAALQLLRAVGIPYVQLSRASEVVDADFVGIDDTTAAREIITHVVEDGHSPIAYVAGPRFSSSAYARERSFLATARSLGVDIPEGLRVTTSLDNSGGRVAAAGLLDGPMPPRAIVCGADEIAVGVIEHVLERGLRVPGDVAVTGFGGLPHNRSPLVGLTTVAIPHDAMTKAAVDLLQQRLIDPGRPSQRVVASHELWLGRTCGCTPKAGTPVPAAAVTTRPLVR